MPAKKRQPPRQSGRATRPSARLRSNAGDENPQLNGEATVAEDHAVLPRQSSSKRQKARALRSTNPSRAKPQHGIPEIYNEMLAEALAEEEQAGPSLRPSKRRKMSEEPSSKIELDIDLFGQPGNEGPEETVDDRPPNLQQVVLNDFDESPLSIPTNTCEMMRRNNDNVQIAKVSPHFVKVSHPPFHVPPHSHSRRKS